MVTVNIKQDIPRPLFGVFPRFYSRIHYDSKAAKTKKMHCLLYQQGMHYGEIGDCCDYLSHDELLELERQGYISISGIHRTTRGAS